MENKARLTLFVLARLVVVTFFLVATLVLSAKEPESFSSQALFYFVGLIVVTYVFSILSLIALKLTDRYILSLTYLQIIWDVVFVTILLLMTGGINSPFSVLYLLAIINASVLLARKEALYTASLCSILYGAMVNLIYYGFLAPFKITYLPPLQFDTNYIFYITFFNILAYYLVALLTGNLAERARKSEHALLDKVIDYEELERLHSSIVSNLTSGMLTINRDGKIRVFNHYAETLTGITQEEAYDKLLEEIIPEFSAFAQETSFIKRGELVYHAHHGDVYTLGFSTALLTDKMGEHVGTIINFQDLTQIKQMEVELKRSDRLAAVGKLSAGIAHEIRNPLAAISGSVQMIANGNNVSQADKKLLEITLRETERLNKLIKDFLSYARPVQPTKVSVRMKNFLADIQALLSADYRFERVKLNFTVSENLTIDVDVDQFRQVFWNLLVNAAESMPEGGSINIDVVPSGDYYDTFYRHYLKIVVSDTGSGMDADQLNRLFEPFYTTKTEGSGLGLATVYNIVEAHDGKIHVSSIKGTGTMFTIFLPV
jgi:two-component system, NtrC family, sensor histidine kinase PilS